MRVDKVQIPEMVYIFYDESGITHFGCESMA